MSTVVRPSLTLKNMGVNTKKAAALEKVGDKMLFGTIHGIAEKVKTKVSQDKTGQSITYEPIIGTFEGIPAEAIKEKDGDTEITIDAIQSGVLYLPGGIHDMLATPLKQPDCKPISFAIEVYGVRADNPAGFTFEVRALTKPEAADPLAATRAAIVEKKKLALGSPKAEGSKAKAS